MSSQNPVQSAADTATARDGAENRIPAGEEVLRATPRIAPPPKAESGTNYCKPDTTPWWKHVVELAAVLVGLYVAVIYTRQLKQMIDGNTLQRTSLKAELKVTPDDFSIFPMIDSGQKGSPVIAWDVMIPMENIGNTRTKDLSYLVSADILTPLNGVWNGVPDEYPFPQRGNIVYGNISGHSKMSFSPFPVRVEDIEKVQRGTEHVLFHGWARYHDIFEKTPEHLLMFCYEMTHFAKNPRDISDLEKAPPVLWSACNKHNCEDNECNERQEKGLPNGFVFAE